MPDHTPSTPFTPVAAPARHDGWTAERQRVFIETLAETGCVSESAAAAGMTPKSAYRLRSRTGAGPFASAWDEALVVASQRLVAVAFERALTGVPRDVWYKGEKVGVEHRPNDRLLTWLLTHLDAARFGALATFQGEFSDPRDDANQEVRRLSYRFKDETDATGDCRDPCESSSQA